jgi:hypothetical protein
MSINKQTIDPQRRETDRKKWQYCLAGYVHEYDDQPLKDAFHEVHAIVNRWERVSEILLRTVKNHCLIAESVHKKTDCPAIDGGKVMLISAPTVVWMRLHKNTQSLSDRRFPTMRIQYCYCVPLPYRNEKNVLKQSLYIWTRISRARICNRFPAYSGQVRPPYLTYRPVRLAESIPWNRLPGFLRVYKFGLLELKWWGAVWGFFPLRPLPPPPKFCCFMTTFPFLFIIFNKWFLCLIGRRGKFSFTWPSTSAAGHRTPPIRSG